VRRAVLFDLYDTLVHVDIPGVMTSRQRIAAACNVDPEHFQTLWNQHLPQRTLGSLGTLEDEIRAIVKLLRTDAGAGVAGAGVDGEAGVAVAGIDADAIDEAALIVELAAGDRLAWAEAARLYPDALATLSALRERGFSLGLVSNCSCQAADVIEATGLNRHLDALALSFELGVAKPEPGIFLAACERLNVAPEECVFVADGAGGELEAAHTLGMLAVWVDGPDGRRRSSLPPAYDVRVEQLAEVLSLDELKESLQNAQPAAADP
jgi:putative hydrolase of the HAD superfamily